MKSLFFIVGNSRSGTTLLARIIKKHPKMHVLNETHFMEEFQYERENFSALKKDDLYILVNRMLTIQRKDYYRKNQYEEYHKEAEKILNSFFKLSFPSFSSLIKVFFEHEAIRAGKIRAGDQTPRHIFFVDDLISMYPDAKFIHIIRDPRAIAYSQRNKWKAAARLGQPRFEISRTRLNYHPITITFLWNKVMEAGRTAKATCSPATFLSIQFEDLIKHPEIEIKKICDLLEINFTPSMLDTSVSMSAHEVDEGKSGISQTISVRWKEGLSKTELFLVEKIAEEKMINYGYIPIKSHPSTFGIMAYLIYWPFQLAIALSLNLGRMGNPITYFYRRLKN